ncbi:DNA-binding Lrp family transcriptional regulator [Litoreibacter ponti]|uniref:DNA-binding Lrp family transcriptional regulator n=1 Tax=Litoreibacter ponti TaxID=1510457 RepID=A0A2T6BNE5_9RHOB|nr:Lrp/AsnC family transcriptional regulator [Litoreibacter ponti]PTX57603.1 DNA-binding Lrp family transcriptional regulator [Litoreibacter ponti]
MDEIDRAMIAHLKMDGRASITTLAGQLGVSRVTAQARLKRLVDSRVIRKFTVELGDARLDASIKAVMMVEVAGTHANAVVRRLRRMPEIDDLHTTNGVWDLVAFIEVASLPDFDRVLREVREIPGVTRSETSLMLDRAQR